MAATAASLASRIFSPLIDPIARAVAPVMRPISRAYDTVSPYTSVMFPGTAQMLESARAAATGDPMAFYKSRLMPGVQSGRDVFERNPLGRTAYGALSQFPGMSNIPGFGQWMAAAKPRPVPVPALAFEHAAPELQELLMSGRFLPPPGYPGAAAYG